MIVILVIFVILICIVALSKNYFIGSLNNEELIFSDGYKTVNPDIANININNLIIKANKVINQPLCLAINNKMLMHSKDKPLTLKNTSKVNNNYNFKLLNVINNEIVIFHPETSSYIYSNAVDTKSDNNISIGQVNIFKPEQMNKAKFSLIYTPAEISFIDKLLNRDTTDLLSSVGSFSLQHIESGLYLSENADSKLVLSNSKTDVKLMFYSVMEKIGKVDELISDMVEGFGADKSDDNMNKRGMCSMVQNGLVPSSLIPCNYTDDIETFNNTDDNTNNTRILKDTIDFNVFDPHIGMDYQKLFKSYGKNLYNDDLEAIDGVNTLDYLKNYHMSILNKNNELQKHIDKESLKLEHVLDTKMEDLELVKLNKDSMIYYTFKDK
jgi:hypothetical protein